MQLKGVLETLKQSSPLVHCITNQVTVNDCANILLSCGCSPIMADEASEVEEITAMAHALVLNIGTLNHQTISAMALACAKATSLQIPVVLDPVGAGASRLRFETATRLLTNKNQGATVLRGNHSEIKALADEGSGSRGVDATLADGITSDNLATVIDTANFLSKRCNAVVAITGAIDVVTYRDKTYIIRNGHPMLSRITGTGCMLSALIGGFVGANPQNPLEATTAAIAVMGLCGEIAERKTIQQGGGTATFRTALLDAVSLLDEATLLEGARIESR